MRAALNAVLEHRRRAFALLLGVFVVWHAVIYTLGVRFDASSLERLSPNAIGNWALLDPGWLKEDLFRSLTVLHSQPPLFNLVVGIVLKIAGSQTPPALHLLFAGAELAMYLAMFDLLRWLGVAPLVAFLLSTAYLVSPGTALYEHWLSYTLPVGALLILSARMLASALDSPTRAAITGALILTACLVGIRSIFQPLFFFAVAGGLVWALPGQRKRVLVGAAIPGLCIVAWMIRGEILFDTATSSSWLGMNVARVVTEGFTREELADLVAARKVSPIMAIQPFSRVDAYPSSMASPEAEDGWENSPALVAADKPRGGVNYNHWVYLRASRVYLYDSLAVLAIDPMKALRGVARGWLRYFFSSAQYGGLPATNVKALRPVWWNDAVSVEVPLPAPLVGFTTVPLFFLLGLLTTLIGALTLGVRAPAWAAFRTNQRLIVCFLCLTAIGFAVISCSFETGENNRMRAEVDPVHIVLVGVMLDRLSRWRKARAAKPVVSE